MITQHAEQSFVNLHDWFHTPHGERVAAAFADELKEPSDAIHGESLLQFTSCGQNPWLKQFSFKNQWIASSSSSLDNTSIITSFTALPFERDSIDCIIAPLTLEAYPAHMTPIDEMDRVLRPNGHIVFFGINPHGLWGLQAKLSQSSCFKKESVHLHTGYYLRREMMHRGYKPCFWSAFYYIPPVESEAWVARLEVLNTVGNMLWSIPSGFYCFIVKKQTLSLLRPQRIQTSPIIAPIISLT